MLYPLSEIECAGFQQSTIHDLFSHSTNITPFHSHSNYSTSQFCSFPLQKPSKNTFSIRNPNPIPPFSTFSASRNSRFCEQSVNLFHLPTTSNFEHPCAWCRGKLREMVISCFVSVLVHWISVCCFTSCEKRVFFFVALFNCLIYLVIHLILWCCCLNFCENSSRLFNLVCGIWLMLYFFCLLQPMICIFCAI